MTVVEELARIDLFDGLSADELAAWAEVTEIRETEPGELLLAQGVESPGLLLIFEGTAATQQASNGRIDPGTPNTGPTWIGAIAAITESALPLSVLAETKCRIAMVPREAFIELACAQPEVHRRVMKVIGPVMRGVNAREANRERLASLGTMAAGLAHELNNPAAAARRAASHLADALDIISSAIGDFVEKGIERDEAEKIVALQQEALASAKARGPLDGLDAADAEDEMIDALEECGIEDAWKLAEPLAAAGVDKDWLMRVDAIAGDATPKVLRWVTAGLTARGLAEELKDSTDRMSNLVKAVKTYAYMDRGDVVTADVHEGLESTLTILNYKLKHTQIKIDRHYDKSLPPLTMRGSELNQVWTNLIDNAIDALGEDGTITVSTQPDQGCIRVDIADDGPGIPAAVKARVLDPFFTTKPVGSGTGMGLDTARRIVEERHRGSLTFDTGAGGTVFHVWLPLEAS